MMNISSLHYFFLREVASGIVFFIIYDEDLAIVSTYDAKLKVHNKIYSISSLQMTGSLA